MEDPLLKFKHKFIEEAFTLLDNLEGHLIELENSPHNKELIEKVFRCMHTFKGVSGMYGYEDISNITHQLENIYDLVRENQIVVTPKIIQTTLATADFVRAGLSDEADATHNNNLLQNITSEINKIISEAGIDMKKDKVKPKVKHKQNVFATWLISFTPDESLIHRGVNIMYTFGDLFELGTYNIIKNEHNDNYSIYLYTDKNYEDIEDVLLFILDECRITKIAEYDIFNEQELDENKTIQPEVKYNYVNTRELANQENEPTESNPFSATETATVNTHNITRNKINIDAVKLDELMFLVSELITTNSQIHIASKAQSLNQLKPLLEKVDNLSKSFRNNALNLRLISLNDIVIRFKRLVHDLSHQLNKEVELVTQGTDTELDKSTIDALVDPMMHLIRNCIDHGIEEPEKRIQAGKTPKGTIKITAFHSGSFVYIQIQDDGKGIKPEIIRQKAVEKGIISADAQLTEKEIYDLIFLPGLSTAESLTHVSGRGVGMDVVKKKITELRGQVEILSEINTGTTFTLKLHQTIAIIDTLLFQIDDLYLLVPVSEIVECQLIHSSKVNTNTGTVPYHEKQITYIDLYRIFDLEQKPCINSKLIIINRQDNFFAIEADSIIGEHQAVLKSLGRHLKHQDKIAGASILGDGNLAYLLDMNAIELCEI